MKKGFIDVWCRNLLCHRRPTIIHVDRFNKNYDTMRCPDCGFIGFMPRYHVLNWQSIIDQIVSWRDSRLLRECFLLINYDKLPGTFDIQKLDTKQSREPRFDIDIIAVKENKK